MADATLRHRRIVGKPMPSALDTTSTASILLGSTVLTSATLVDGLVQRDPVDPDVKVGILATVDETGSVGGKRCAGHTLAGKFQGSSSLVRFCLWLATMAWSVALSHA